MMEELAPDRDIRVLQGRRVLDTALGVLVALRRYREQDAFGELLGAAQRHQVPVFALASALVKMVAGEPVLGRNPAAQAAAQQEWHDLVPQSSPVVVGGVGS